jgi:hypothetical protein
MTNTSHDFREAFARMAPEALINRLELAALLATTPGAVTQMAYRGELPTTAFPEKRRACWFVGDIRRWLGEAAARRLANVDQEPVESVSPRVGRPRLPANA